MLAAELGLELIITDHHTPGPVLPAARAIVHPAVGPGDYPFAGLCGAGVAFKLAWVLCQRANRSKRVSQPMRDFLLQALALVALGTVADVVPLVDENRALVRHGLGKPEAATAAGRGGADGRCRTGRQAADCRARTSPFRSRRG